MIDYRGWFLTDDEYEHFGYAVHTAVPLPGLSLDEASSDRYLLLGDPTAPAAQINCRTGTQEEANVQLVLDAGAWRGAAKKEGVSQAVVTVRVAAEQVCA